jgi:hypothetical protein
LKIISAVLQEKLTRLALYIGYIGMTAAALTLICLIIRFCISTYVIKKQAAQASDVSYFIAFLIQAITVVVVSVPEGSLYFLCNYNLIISVIHRSPIGCDTCPCLRCSS